MRRLIAVTGLLLLLGPGARAEEKTASEPLLPPLRNQVVAEDLRRIAGQEGIRWQERVPAGAVGIAQPGDSVIALVGACDGETTRQWLVRLRRGRPLGREGEDHQVTLFSCWGPVSVFNSAAEPVEVTVIGPVQISPAPSKGAEPRPKVSHTRVLVPGSYMRLGLDGTARSCLGLMQAIARLHAEDPGFKPVNLWSRTSPVPVQEIRLYKPIAARLGRSVEDERLFVGGLLSLQSFYEIAKSEPVLRDIAMIVIDRPSLWALTKTAFGAGPNTQFNLSEELCRINPGEAGLLDPGREVFQLPFEMSLEGRRLVNCLAAVTRPSAPLDVSAGILALIAFHPRDSRRILEIKVVGFGI